MPERRHPWPLWLRLWHSSNALLVVVLAATGISLHFADPKLPLVEFSLAVSVHRVAGVSLVAAYLAFFAGNLVSGNWRQFVPKPVQLGARCRRQLRHYFWGVFAGEPEPFPPNAEENFNPLQAITFGLFMYIVMPAVIGSGLMFLYPSFAPERWLGLNGLLPVAVVHYLSTTLLLLFTIAHIYLGTMGSSKTSRDRTTLTGAHSR